MNAQLSIPLNFEKLTKANFWPWHQSDQSGKKSDPAQTKLSLIWFSDFRSRLTSMNPFSDQDQLVALPKLLQLHSPEWIRIGSFKIRVLQRFESGDKFSNCQIRQECLLTERIRATYQSDWPWLADFPDVIFIFVNVSWVGGQSNWPWHLV